MSLKDAIMHIPTLGKEVTDLLKVLKAKFDTQKFKDAKLQDGNIIRYDGEMPTAGVPIYILDTTGQQLPAPDGELVLEDGTIIVASGGMIAEVKPPATEDPGAKMTDAPANPAQAQTAANVKSVVESIIKETVFSKEEVDEKISAIENIYKEKFEALTAELDKNKFLLKETFSLVEKIASLPSESTTQVKKDGFKQEKPKSGIDKMIEEAKELSTKVFN